MSGNTYSTTFEPDPALLNLKTKKDQSKALILFCLFVPYGLDLSNFIDDFQALRILMNSRNWKSII